METPKTWREYGHAAGCKCHFVAEIKDGDKTLIVYKLWAKTKQRWSYRVEPRWIMERFHWVD